MAGFSAVLEPGESFQTARSVGEQGLFLSVEPTRHPFDVDIETKPDRDAESSYERIEPFNTFGPFTISSGEETFETGRVEGDVRFTLTNNSTERATVNGRAHAIETDEYLLLSGIEALRERYGGDRIVIGANRERDIRFDGVLGSLVVVEHE